MVVVKWSAYVPSTPMIQVRSTVFSVKFVVYWIDRMDFGQPSLKTKQFGSTEGKKTKKIWSIVVFMAD